MSHSHSSPSKLSKQDIINSISNGSLFPWTAPQFDPEIQHFRVIQPNCGACFPTKTHFVLCSNHRSTFHCNCHREFTSESAFKQHKKKARTHAVIPSDVLPKNLEIEEINNRLMRKDHTLSIHFASNGEGWKKQIIDTLQKMDDKEVIQIFTSGFKSGMSAKSFFQYISKSSPFTLISPNTSSPCVVNAPGPITTALNVTVSSAPMGSDRSGMTKQEDLSMKDHCLETKNGDGTVSKPTSPSTLSTTPPETSNSLMFPDDLSPEDVQLVMVQDFGVTGDDQTCVCNVHPTADFSFEEAAFLVTRLYGFSLAERPTTTATTTTTTTTTTTATTSSSTTSLAASPSSSPSTTSTTTASTEITATTSTTSTTPTTLTSGAERDEEGENSNISASQFGGFEPLSLSRNCLQRGGGNETESSVSSSFLSFFRESLSQQTIKDPPSPSLISDIEKDNDMLDNDLDFLLCLITKMFNNGKCECLNPWFESLFTSHRIELPPILSQSSYVLAIPHNVQNGKISHWSISIIFRQAQSIVTIILFDSLGDHFSNSRKTKKAFFVNIINSSPHLKQSKSIDFVDFTSPPWVQKTSHDCGVYVSLFVLAIFHWFNGSNPTLDQLQHLMDQTPLTMKEEFISALKHKFPSEEKMIICENPKKRPNPEPPLVPFKWIERPNHTFNLLNDLRNEGTPLRGFLIWIRYIYSRPLKDFLQLHGLTSGEWVFSWTDDNKHSNELLLFPENKKDTQHLMTIVSLETRVIKEATWITKPEDLPESLLPATIVNVRENWKNIGSWRVQMWDRLSLNALNPCGDGILWAEPGHIPERSRVWIPREIGLRFLPSMEWFQGKGIVTSRFFSDQNLGICVFGENEEVFVDGSQEIFRNKEGAEVEITFKDWMNFPWIIDNYQWKNYVKRNNRYDSTRRRTGRGREWRGRK
jgi:hypothetical protein